MNAAALMTADQYRLEAQKMLDLAEADVKIERRRFRDFFVQAAQVYALLAISAQAAESREDVPF